MQCGWVVNSLLCQLFCQHRSEDPRVRLHGSWKPVAACPTPAPPSLRPRMLSCPERPHHQQEADSPIASEQCSFWGRGGWRTYGVVPVPAVMPYHQHWSCFSVPCMTQKASSTLVLLMLEDWIGPLVRNCFYFNKQLGLKQGCGVGRNFGWGWKWSWRLCVLTPQFSQS